MSDEFYEPYPYSDDFNYSLWTEDTVATLTNVNWDANYRDVVRFANRSKLDEYIDNNSTSLDIPNMTYARPGLPVTLPISINQAMKYNYIRVVNENIPEMSDVTRAYYYFITGVEFASPGATRFMIQLDVWQTFVYDVTFQNCYIERGHIGIANTRAFNNNGRNYLAIPEGLDVGNEYQVVARRSKNVMTEHEDYFEQPVDDPRRQVEGMAVLMATTVHIGETPGTENDPILETAHGSNLQGLPGGAEYYVFKSTADFYNFMIAYAKYPWVTQGIISVTVIPKPARYGYELERVTINSGDNYLDTLVEMYRIKDNLKAGNGTSYDLFPDWRNSDEILGKIPERYRHLKKLLTYPYMVIELTTFTGTPIILKPEVWTDVNARIQERASLVPPNQRIVFQPFRYNSGENYDVDSYTGQGGRTEVLDDGGEYMDMTTQISNFPSMSVVNNGAIGYMASNAHGIAYQHQSAEWSQQKALQGASTSFRQSSENIEAMRQQAQIGRNTDMAATDIANGMSTMNAGMSGINSVLAGSRNPAAIGGGMVNAGLSSMMEQMANNANLGNRLSSSRQSQDVSTGLAGYNRDTNNELAQFVAKGDYAQAIAAINAKVQDARLTQPSTSGQTGGEAFNMIHHMSKISLRFKMMSQANMRAVGEYWLRYGYAVQQFATLPDTMMCMSNFTYWKVSESYITGNVPEQFKQTLRGIIETGVTAWRSPDIIGQIDIADNAPLGGFTL